MPELCRIGSLKFYMFYDDHRGPHFHARYAGRTIAIYFETLEVEDEGARFDSTQKRIALRWAKKRQAELRSAWHRAENHQAIGKIAP